ncbi:MAG TPA: gliding motility-associated C-terminal domain-containing protein [Chitinophagales bacterium]
MMKRFLIFLLTNIAFFAQAQTVVAPRLTCVVNNFGSGNVNITWQNQTNNCGAFVDYEIYGSNTQNGTYTLIATITNPTQTTYTQVGAAAQTWYYFMVANYNCPGATVLHSDTIRNESNPQVPVILSADVDSANNVTFTWAPSTSPQAKYYIVYAYTSNGSVVPLDTIAGRFNTSFYDTQQDPTIQSVCYTVSAGDSCVGNQPSSYNTAPHCTMFLTAQTSLCSQDVTLTWSAYNNMLGGVGAYQILINRNLGGYQVVASVDSSQTTYSYTNFNDGDTLEISIIAVSAADTNIKAHSNYVFMRPSIVQPPRYLHITRVSVTPTNQVEMNFVCDSTSPLLDYGYTNSTDCSNFNLLSFNPVVYPLTQLNAYTDTTAVPNEIATCYQVIAVDSCQARDTSESAKTIFLQATLTDYYEVSLNWTDYEVNGATVNTYTLYRDFGNGYQAIGTFVPGANTIRDSLYQFVNDEGLFCYYIEANYTINLPDVPYTATLTSTSNVACIYHRPIIYIPNAFAPNGVNNVFKPTIIYGDPQGYVLQIFNRYGGKIFESNDVNTGWDGTQNGSPSIQGGYAYLIKFTAIDGTPILRKGIVILIRS